MGIIWYSLILPASLVYALYIGWCTADGNYFRNLQIRGKRSKQGSHFNLHLPTYDDESPPLPPAPAKLLGPYNQLEEEFYDYYNSYNSQQSSISLDDILKSAKGQQIIMEEARQQLLQRIEKNGRQVAEEIVEQLEKDAQLLQQQELSWAHQISSSSLLIYASIIAPAVLEFLMIK